MHTEIPTVKTDGSAQREWQDKGGNAHTGPFPARLRTSKLNTNPTIAQVSPPVPATALNREPVKAPCRSTDYGP